MPLSCIAVLQPTYCHTFELCCSAGANGGALVVSGNGWTLSNISHSTFASNTAAQTESAPSTEGAPDGGERQPSFSFGLSHVTSREGSFVQWHTHCLLCCPSPDSV